MSGPFGDFLAPKREKDAKIAAAQSRCRLSDY